MASGEFAVYDDLWKAMVFHSAGNMTSPSELVFQDHGFDSGILGLLYDFNGGDEVVNVTDGAQAALVEALEEVDVVGIGDPGLRAVEKSGENNSPINTDLCFAFQTFVFHTRSCSLPNELLAFASLLSISSMSILASDEMVQPI